MARTVGDLTLAMRAIDARRASALDGRVPPLAFDDPSALDVKSLRVGVCTHDDGLPLSPAVLRAIDRASAVLRERGVSVRTFTPPRMRDALALYFGAMSADQGKRMLEFNEDAPLDDVLRALRRIAELPSSVRRALASVLARTGDDLAAMLLRVLGEKPVSEFWKLTYAIRSYRFELLEAMDRAKVDVLLCAPHVTPAMPHGGAKDFVLAGAPAMLFNLTQLPAGVVPVTRVRPEETERPTPRGRLERRAAWVDAQSQGLPVGVQVAGRPWRDADVLAILAAIEEGVSGDAFFPKTPVAFA
jgi:fatty acid amide hydrolase